MIKKWWKKQDSKVTAPLLYYLILIIVSCIAFVFGELSSCELSSLESKGIIIIKNMGYGVFGSTIVAFLIDYATTIRKKEHDRKELGTQRFLITVLDCQKYAFLI